MRHEFNTVGVQVDLIRTLKPTVFCGMASYGLQLAQVAERMGFDLANSWLKPFWTAAEPVSPGKRERIEALWGAELFDQFGYRRIVHGEQSNYHDGMHYWTDMFDLEVVDEIPVSRSRAKTAYWSSHRFGT